MKKGLRFGHALFPSTIYYLPFVSPPGRHDTLFNSDGFVSSHLPLGAARL
jgi:hypothetical protein